MSTADTTEPVSDAPPSYITVIGERNPPSYHDLSLQPDAVGQPQISPEFHQEPQNPHISSIHENRSPVNDRTNRPSQVVSFAPETSTINSGIRRNPPSYIEVLEAEGTGRFPVIGSRTQQVMQFYRRDNDDWTSNSTSSSCVTPCNFFFLIFCYFQISFFVL